MPKQPRTRGDKTGPTEPGDHALDRLRQFEEQRGLPETEVPSGEKARPSRGARQGTPKPRARSTRTRRGKGG